MVTKGKKEVEKDNPLHCPFIRAQKIIGGKWKSVIIFYLRNGKMRFGQISARIPGVSRKILTVQLKELELAGLIERHEFKEIPPRVEYELTKLGLSLLPILDAMNEWGKTEAKVIEKSLKKNNA